MQTGNEPLAEMPRMNANITVITANMGIMTHNMDSTMGRMGRWMPWPQAVCASFPAVVAVPGMKGLRGPRRRHCSLICTPTIIPCMLTLPSQRTIQHGLPTTH
jgi:hypothetical protein